MKIFKTLLISSLILASCSENDDNNYVACTADVTMPEGVEAADLTEPHFTFTNLSDGRRSNYDGTTASAQLPPGLYDITFTANTTLENGADATVRASKQAVDITSDTNVNLEAYILTSSDDLIISEIFFTAHSRPQATATPATSTSNSTTTPTTPSMPMASQSSRPSSLPPQSMTIPPM